MTEGCFAGKRVAITGAGVGVGRGLAVGFAKDGAEVFGISRNADELAATAELCEGRMTAVAGDVTQAEDVERLLAAAEGEGCGVDILINNAAIYPKERFLDQSFEAWDACLKVNVSGMARCCHRALPGMLERGYGRILNVGSFAWQGPIPTASAYSTSKGGVHALTKAIACEIEKLRHPDVQINEWIPGIVQTRMTPDTGDDPMQVYPHIKPVLLRPVGSLHGLVFLRSEQVGSARPRSLARRVIGKILGR